MKRFNEGDVVYFISSSVFIKKATVIRNAGGFCTIRFSDGNYDGITNTFEDAKKDWQTNTYTLDYYRSRMGGIVFANPK